MVDDRNGNGLALFFAGIAIGAVAGLLLAPDSGQETRRKVLGASKNLKEKATEEFRQGLERLEANISSPFSHDNRYQEAFRAGWKAFMDTLDTGHEEKTSTGI